MLKKVQWRFAFFFFSKWCEENFPVEVAFLVVGCVWNLFLQYPPHDISRGQVSVTEPLALRIRGASWHLWLNCSYSKCLQGGSTLPCPPLANRATRALGKFGFLGCEFRVECLSKQPRACFLRLSCFKASHIHTLTRLIPPGSAAPCLGCLGS